MKADRNIQCFQYANFALQVGMPQTKLWTGMFKSLLQLYVAPEVHRMIAATYVRELSRPTFG